MVKIREDLPKTVDGEIDLDQWIERISTSTRDASTVVDKVLLKDIGELSAQTGTALTPELESCYRQGLHTAERLAALGADNETLAAALLYDSYRYGNREKIIFYFHSHAFYASILQLLTTVIKIDQIIDKQIKQSKYTQKNLRFLILALANDHRIILIKLANHMSALRACANPLHFDTNEALRIQLSQEARYLYGPLANRLGIGQLKWELEDYSFRYLEPEAYKKIARMLDEKRSQREVTIEETKLTLKKALEKQNIEAVISGRAKHIYSIFRKMTRKHVDFKEIYDVYAIRMIVPEIEDCYAALGIVQSLWQPISKEFDDYIMTPKKNGYRSLHTAVVGPQGRALEIQIRTEEMHQKAELGVAAHWIYKENDAKDTKKPVEDSIVSFRRVYVLSPQGDIIALPVGSTPLDFAYHIHTELGHRCRGAKVNGKMVPLTYHLRSGDEIEIVSVKIGTPSRDWSNKHLGYLKTIRAISKVNAWFRRQEALESDKDQKEEKREIPKDPPKTLNDSVVLKTLTKPNKPYGVDRNQSNIEIAGVGNLLCHFAKCCKPLPGDAIIGYITQGHGVTVHRQDCNQIHMQFMEDNRLIQVNWGQGTSQNSHVYPVDIMISTDDRQHILQDITALFSQEKLNVTALHSILDENNNAAVVHLTFEISDLTQLEKMMTKIRRIPKVLMVNRV